MAAVDMGWILTGLWWFIAAVGFVCMVAVITAVVVAGVKYWRREMR